ncbi:hypothetical protein D3C76_927010 [compost metagenome]
MLLRFHETAFFIDDEIFAFDTPGESFLPIFLNQAIPQLENLHDLLFAGVDTDAKAVVQVQRRAVQIVVFRACIVYQRQAHISSFVFIRRNHHVLGTLEVPVLVKHPKDVPAGNFRLILVIVLRKGFFVDQT